MYLSQHPQIHIAAQKEIHFFDLRYDQGVDWYRAQFDDATEPMLGEASPSYMFSEDAIRRMHELVPDAKLIAILREPVSRAYSAYWFLNSLAPEGLTFEQTLEQQAAPGFMTRFGRPGVLTASTYLPALERVTRYYPRSSLHVLLLDDLKRDADGAFAGLCRFLGVDDTVKPASLGSTVNKTHALRSVGLYRMMMRYRAWRRLPFRLGYTIDRWNQRAVDYPPIDPATKQRLKQHFAEHNARLAEWLGRDLSDWEK